MKQLFNLIKMQYKILFSIKKYMLFLFLIAMAMIIFNRDMLISGASVLIMGLTYTVQAYEEKSKTVNLIYTLPVNPKTYVLSKYIYGYLSILISILLISVINFVAAKFNYDLLGSMSVYYVLTSLIGVGTFITIVVIPIVLVFGFEKIRVILMLLIMFPVIVAQTLSINIPDFVFFSGSYGKIIITTSAVVFILTISIISYLIISYLYCRKDK